MKNLYSLQSAVLLETMTDKNIDKEDEEDHSYLSDDVGFNDDSCIL